MTEARRIEGGTSPDDRLTDRALYFNREISWLAFNRRVLEEALDPSWALLERLKFLAIFHSNLDEFFMIRVSGLHEQLEAAVTERSADGLSAQEQLKTICEIVRRDCGLAVSTLTGDVLPGPRTGCLEEELERCGRILRDVLDLAASLPAKHDPDLRYPRLVR